MANSFYNPSKEFSKKKHNSKVGIFFFFLDFAHNRGTSHVAEHKNWCLVYYKCVGVTELMGSNAAGDHFLYIVQENCYHNFRSYLQKRLLWQSEYPEGRNSNFSAKVKQSSITPFGSQTETFCFYKICPLQSPLFCTSRLKENKRNLLCSSEKSFDRKNIPNKNTFLINHKIQTPFLWNYQPSFFHQLLVVKKFWIESF